MNDSACNTTDRVNSLNEIGGGKVPQVYKNNDEIKRKLRGLKKLEMKVRLNSLELNSKKSFRNSKNIELVWDKFFDLKGESTKAVKYTINQLSLMTKVEFKDVINDYFYHVYYWCYKESGFIDNYIVDSEILTQLGLPIIETSEIKKKFRELAKIYHPDNGGDSDKFNTLMKQYRDSKKLKSD